MACFHPIDAWQSVAKDARGKTELIFKRPRGSRAFSPVKLPCGQCVGCRLQRSKTWAMRCVHEASLHEENCFITLTYNNQFLPDDRSLDVRDFQLFMKRLRRRFGKGIRFFHCGEYGERFGRPHYHACIFGFDFPDRVLWKVSPTGERLYTSDILSELWGKGFCSIGDVTFKSAAYVARYIMKKINGDRADEHYFDSSTGVFLKPEYVTMSRRPGIGRAWYDKYKTDVFPSDFLIVNGAKCKPPRYYDSIYEVSNPDGFEFIKNERKRQAKKHLDNNTPDRLRIREIVENARLKTLKRDGVD